MSRRGLLDADMRTVGGWLAAGSRWWLDELAAMIPAGLRGGQARVPVLRYDPGGSLSPADTAGGVGLSPAPLSDRPTAILLPRDLCLTRLIVRPTMTERDVARMIAIDADRVMPLPAGGMLVVGALAGRERAENRIEIAVAGLPIDQARTIGTTLADAGVLPARILVDVAATSGAVQVDLLPAMRAAGVLPSPRNLAAYWWAAVIFLFLLNVAILLWRDMARTDGLGDMVAAQQPAVSTAQRIVARVERDRRTAERTLALRRTHEPLALIGRVGRALPPGAWVQRFTWQGDGIRLAGFRPRGADVAGGLRRAGFADVRYAADEQPAAMAAGQPFEITARLARP